MAVVNEVLSDIEVSAACSTTVLFCNRPNVSATLKVDLSMTGEILKLQATIISITHKCTAIKAFL